MSGTREFVYALAWAFNMALAVVVALQLVGLYPPVDVGELGFLCVLMFAQLSAFLFATGVMDSEGFGS